MNYPDYLTPNARRTLKGLGSPPLPPPGESITITEHVYHPDSTYTVRVNAFGDVEISSMTRNQFGGQHASGYSISRNPEEE